MSPPRAVVCPRCSSNRIKRSHSRTIVETALKTLNVRAYRCINCGWRGFRRNKKPEPPIRAKYSLIQTFLIVSALGLAVIGLLYYLAREEPKQEILLGRDAIFSLAKRSI